MEMDCDSLAFNARNSLRNAVASSTGVPLAPIKKQEIVARSRFSSIHSIENDLREFERFKRAVAAGREFTTCGREREGFELLLRQIRAKRCHWRGAFPPE
jgi:hypothetical protein